MEVFRTKANATNFVFPLVTSGSNTYYTTSAWTNLTNKSISAYSWADTIAPTVLILSQTPSQLSATGLWSLSATGSEMNPGSGAHDYIAIKLKADQIQEQSILVLLTDYSIKKLADTSNKVNANQVQVSGINSGLYVGTSAYTNFPQVTVSANLDKINYSISGTKKLLDDLNDIDGTAVTATSIPEVTVGEVTVSAYNNFPKVCVSANEDKTEYALSGTKKVLDDLNDIDGSSVTATSIPEVVVGQVTVSAYNNFPQVYVSANGDKTGYSITANSDKDGYSIVNEVTVSAYNNFPQVTVVTNLDKANYGISGIKQSLDVLNDIDGSSVTATSVTDKINYSISGTKKLLDDLNDIDGTSVTATDIPEINVGEVTVSAYNNFPSVNVSSITNEAITSSDFNVDYYNKIQSLTNVSVSVGSVNVSSVDSGLYVGTSAYINFPQVTVSANLDKTNYTVSSGSITAVNGDVTGSVASITNHVSVSAYTNFPKVTVSANEDKINYSISGTKKLLDDLNDIDGSSVTATSVTDKTGYNVSAGIVNTVTNPITVSAFQNFPQVTVITNLDKTNYTVSGGTINNVINSLTVSAYNNFPSVNVSSVDSGVTVSATIGNVTVSALDQNAINQIQNGLASATNLTNVQTTVNAISAQTNQLTFVGSSVNANITNEVMISAYNNFPSVNVSSINNDAITSGDFTNDYWNKIDSLTDPNASAVRVSAIDVGLYVGTSAYINFPQVTVSAYQNMPQVQVSGINIDVINQIQSGLSSAIDSDIIENTVNAISAITSQIIFTNSAINSYVNNEVIVSAYNNFPSVNVSSISNSAITSASYSTDFWQTVQSYNTLALHDIVSAVWDETLTSSTHNIDNSAGKTLRVLSTSGTAITAITSAAVNDILNTIIDTKTLTEIFTILLANAAGNCDRSGYVFTYKKQDGSTTAFQNTMTSLTRRRTD